MTPNHDDLAVQILSNAGAMCGVCGDEPGDRTCPDCDNVRRRYVAALRAAGWAHRRDIQHQLDQAHNELAAIKKEIADLIAVAGGTR